MILSRFLGLLAAVSISLWLLTSALQAQVPQLINYQGRLAVSGTNFTGSGQFKFALVSGSSPNVTLWSNDGTGMAGGAPLNAVALAVSQGLYSVQLGDTAVENMTAIPATVFSNSDVRLRVWFNDGNHGWQQLAPDQRISAVGYAMIASTVPDKSITSDKIAPGAAEANILASSLNSMVALKSDLPALATNSDVAAGTSHSTIITPATLQYAINATVNQILPSNGGRGRLAAKSSANPPANPSILTVGDSLSEGRVYAFRDSVKAKYGVLTGQGPGAPLASVDSGPVTKVTGFGLWPNGFHKVASAGGIIEWKNDTVHPVECNLAKVYYVKENGAGTFQIESSINGGAYTPASGVIDASNTSQEGAVAQVKLPNGLNSIRVVVLSGSVRFLDARYQLTGVAGASIAGLHKGGCNIAALLSSPAAIINPILADLAPDVVIFQAMEDPGFIAEHLPAFYAKINTALGYTPDWVFIGDVQVLNYGRIELQAFAESVGQVYIDPTKFINPQNGLLSSDGSHATPNGQTVLSNRIMTLPPFSDSVVTLSEVRDDSSPITRYNVKQESVWSVGNLWNLRSALVGSSGVGASASAPGDGGIASLSCGSEINGYARATLAKGITNDPDASGVGMNHSVPVRLGICFTGIARSASLTRFIFGGNGGVPAPADTNALSTKGWGVETQIQGGVFKARLFAHNGSAYTVSGWTTIRGSMHTYESVYAFVMENLGNGTLNLYLNARGGYPSYVPAISLSGGPTGTGGRCLDMAVVNPSNGTVENTKTTLLEARLEIDR